MTYNEQPSSVCGSLSAMIYQAYDSASSNSDFVYKFEVYVWNGTAVKPATPVVTIEKNPDVYAGRRAKIDISRIALQYTSKNKFNVGSYQADIGEGACYVIVDVTGYWNDGANQTTTSSSNRIVVTRGYTYVDEGFNASYTPTLVLTDKTTLYVTTDTINEYLWYDANNIQTISVGSTTATSNPVADSGTEIQGIDIRQLMEAEGVWGTDSTITFNGTGGSKDIEVKFECSTRYGSYTILYLNKYGVYESFTCNGVTNEIESISRENMQSAIFNTTALDNAWSYGVRQKNYYNVNAMRSRIVNTNWLPESHNEIIRQIQLSEALYYATSDFNYACNIVDNQIQYKTATNEKLIQYTMQLEYAQPVINSIVR